MQFSFQTIMRLVGGVGRHVVNPTVKKYMIHPRKAVKVELLKKKHDKFKIKNKKVKINGNKPVTSNQ